MAVIIEQTRPSLLSFFLLGNDFSEGSKRVLFAVFYKSSLCLKTSFSSDLCLWKLLFLRSLDILLELIEGASVRNYQGLNLSKLSFKTLL